MKDLGWDTDGAIEHPFESPRSDPQRRSDIGHTRDPLATQVRHRLQDQRCVSRHGRLPAARGRVLLAYATVKKALERREALVRWCRSDGVSHLLGETAPEQGEWYSHSRQLIERRRHERDGAAGSEAHADDLPALIEGHDARRLHDTNEDRRRGLRRWPAVDHDAGTPIRQ